MQGITTFKEYLFTRDKQTSFNKIFFIINFDAFNNLFN